MNNNIDSSVLFWPMLALACLIIFTFSLNKVIHRTSWDDRRKRNVFTFTLIVIISWIALLSVLSLKGFFADFTHLPPRPVLIILLPLIFVLWFIFSKSGSELLSHASPQGLIYMQSFRIIVELLLWLSFLNHVLPVQMTFEGGNLDILSGILALPAGYFVMKNRQASLVSLVYNILGLGLLINILIIAIRSFPTPLRHYLNEPSNAIIAQFPYILLPGVLVPLAYSLHLFSLRQWFLMKSKKI